MPRKPRFILPGIPQHVIQRGNNREPCFFSEQDFTRYKEDLKIACDKFQCHVHAYVLMTNHVHLLITPLTTYSLSEVMQSLGRRYVRFINTTYHRSGTLWEGRFKASIVDSEAYLLSCMRYIELNPVRASMVNHPAEYRWSSYAANALGQKDIMVTPHPLYTALDKIASQRQHAYRELFCHHMNTTLLHSIRDALNQELVLGRDDFKDKIEQMTKRQTREKQPGRPRINELLELDIID